MQRDEALREDGEACMTQADIDQMISDIEEYVDGGCCKSINEILTELGYAETDDLDKEATDAIDGTVFTCIQCDWTMPIDCMCEKKDETCDECFQKEIEEDHLEYEDEDE